MLRGEALAGLTVGLMVIPQGVAYAVLAGMPLVTGIYASLLPALVAVLFSASVRLSVGPTALTCLLIHASLAGMAEPGSPEWVHLAVWLSVLSGALQVALGLAHTGWMLNLVNAPVLTAFTQAASVLIVVSQLPDLLGLPRAWSWSQWESGFPGFQWPALAFGLAAWGFLVVSRRFSRRLPSVLLVVVVSAVLSQLWGLEAAGVRVVGALPAGLPDLYLPHWPGWQVLGDLALPVLVITLVSFLETASSAKVDHQRRGSLWRQDQDLIGQGLAKLASGLCGAFPSSSSFSRSALNLYAGAQTGWATVFSVVVVGLALFVFLPVLHHVPRSVLAAVVIVAVVGLIQPREFLRLWRIAKPEAAIAGVTFVLTLAYAPQLYKGVIAGVLLSLAYFLHGRLHPRIVEVGLHADGRLRDRHLWHLPPLASHTYALRMDAALDFGSANAFEQAIVGHLSRHPETRCVVWIATSVNSVDATGVDCLQRLQQQLAERRCRWMVVGLKLPAERVLRAAGLLDQAGQPELWATEAEALAVLQSPSAHR